MWQNSRFLLAFIWLLASSSALGGETGAASQTEPVSPERHVTLLAVHSEKYQNFTRNRVDCEVFGEMKNIGRRSITSVVLEVEFLDEQGGLVYREDLTLLPRIIRPGKPTGDQRPLRPGEIGYFTVTPSRCPKRWLEGRITHHLKAVTFLPGQ